MSNTPFIRLRPSAYADGAHIPRGGLTSPSLPSARAVSVAVHQDKKGQRLHQPVSLMVMQFGQFLDHDITLTQEPDLKCCDMDILGKDEAENEQLRSCFNIDIQNDIFYNHKMDCLPFTRSGATCTDSRQREQINLLTSFIDGSNVYGSDDHRATQLRSLRGGLLK